MSSSVHDASQVILNQKADKQPDGSYLVGGRTIQADLTYVTAGARPNTSDLAETAPLDSKGFIKVPCLGPLALSLPSPHPQHPLLCGTCTYRVNPLLGVTCYFLPFTSACLLTNALRMRNHNRYQHPAYQ